jgi:hypothetical protein
MKIAIVTGASSGIGREFVVQISQRYPRLDEIWVLARREELLYELQEELSMPVRVIPSDLTRDDDLRRFSLILETYKPDVKLLVNSAGYGVLSTFELSSYEDQTGMIDVNCRALTAITYLVLPYMKKNSRIIQMASAAAFLPQPDFSIYAASKAFVLSFSKALGIELRGRGISVTAVCPGPVKTEFFNRADPDGRVKWYKKMVMIKPEKVVSKALRDAALADAVSIPGISMKVFYAATKLLPERILLKFYKGGTGNE